MSKTNKKAWTLGQLEDIANKALAGRGKLHVSTSIYGYGDAVIHFVGDMMQAHNIAATIPGFHVVTTYRTETGATARGYMTGEGLAA